MPEGKLVGSVVRSGPGVSQSPADDCSNGHLGTELGLMGSNCLVVQRLENG